MIKAVKQNGLPAGAAALAALGMAVTGAMAEQRSEPVPDSQSRPGENLTERLERTDGVIKPPPIDAPMQIKPPENITRTPVIKPPIEQQTPGGGPAEPQADTSDRKKRDGLP
jgi:hypothetical protein